MPGDLTEAKPDGDGARRRSWLGRIASMPNDGIAKTLIVALLVALFGSVLVSGSAILLRPRIEANLEGERQRNLLEIVQRLPGIEQLFDRVEGAAVEAFVVDLATGEIDRSMLPEQLDSRAAAQDPSRSVAIPSDRDIAGIKRRSSHEVVYLLRSSGMLRLIVLPVRGQGYASTLYGYLGLAGDANTVVGLGFYQHGETPGLGGQVDSPEWRARWEGKMVLSPDGKLRIGVAKGAPTAANAPYEVDGLTGATFTSQGVNNLVRFWLGDDGFGPFLNRIRQQ
ncbi:MAG: Na(+)-translocating NADH-quinone reductase subunit C [Aestuariivirga sp.]|nr:Na(+)-translocating NADH-quinone reductase subunit C [Aestuariivirga sp.]